MNVTVNDLFQIIGNLYVELIALKSKLALLESNQKSSKEEQKT